MKILTPTILVYGLAFILGLALMLSAQAVQHKERNLFQLKQHKVGLEDEIKLLRAEWSYLNSPQRLAALLQNTEMVDKSEQDAPHIYHSFTEFLLQPTPPLKGTSMPVKLDQMPTE